MADPIIRADEDEAGGMTVQEAGRLGGAKRKAALGEDGYSALGKLGGAKTSSRHGPEFYSAIGRLGGSKVARERGPEYFSEIGKKGGSRVAELIARGKRDEAAGE